MKWTKEQREAIYTEGKNILVSAAAGSGKTTILIRRIINLIIEKEVDVDRFLITTFTNAAATEMKEKLEKEINAGIEECDKNGDRKKRDFLRKQITLLPDACIETFHSFSIGIIRDYFFLTDIQPGFTIGDETRVSLMKKEALDNVFEERFKSDGESFKAFLRKYSTERSDYRIKETILDIYREMLSMPEYMKWAEERVSLLDSDSPVRSLKIDRFIRKEAASKLMEAAAYYERVARLLDDPDTDNLHSKAVQDVESAKKLAAMISEDESLTVDAIGSLIDDFKPNTLRAAGDIEKGAYDGALKEDVQSTRRKAKGAIDGIKKKYYAQPFEKADEDIRSLHEDTEYLLGIIRDMDSLLKERKKEENIIDFDDAMHHAIGILQDEKAASDYRNRFEYIFIDEYQDSNYLQERIVERIAGKNNLFMVGDVKQSIYKFRLAEPEIFRGKYLDYRRPEEELSVKIDLNNNFRSKGNIRRVVNRIFEDVMEGYDEDAALRGPEGGSPEGPGVELHLICGGKDGEEDELEPLTEAELAASLIKEHLGEEYTDRNGQIKTLEYSDIAVLSRGGSAVAQIERYLNNEDIPAYGETGGGYYETVEIRVFLDLLEVISNFRQDVPLIGVMSAMFFDFTPAELAEIRIEGKNHKYYCDAVITYGEKGRDPKLRARVRQMIEQIGRWREISRTLPLDELMRTLLYETGYYDYCSSLPAGERRVSNLRLLMERAATYEETSYLGLYGFLSYVEAMKKNRQKVNEAPVSGEGENVVRVMTVHKSKGLEFPMVILVGAGRQIKGKSSGSSPSVHKDFSLALPLVDRDAHIRKRTLLQHVINGKKQSDEIEEEIRILYVALTRAMDRLAVIGTVADEEKLPQVAGRASFLEMIYPPMCVLEKEEGDPASIHMHYGIGARPEQGSNAPVRERSRGKIGSEVSAETVKEIDRRLSYEYPYPQAMQVRPKYSVSMLANGYEEDVDKGLELPLEEMPSDEILSLGTGEKPLTAARIGTVMHDIMERIDFSRAEKEGEEYIRAFIEEMRDENMLTEIEFEHAYDDDSVKGIVAFFEDPLGKRAAHARKLRKENEFIMRREVEGEAIVVQGKIDCWFEEDGEIVLIDYKNNKPGRYGDEKKIVEEYTNQVKLYTQALEKAENMKVKEAWLYLFKGRKFLAL